MLCMRNMIADSADSADFRLACTVIGVVAVIRNLQQLSLVPPRFAVEMPASFEYLNGLKALGMWHGHSRPMSWTAALCRADWPQPR